VTATVCLWCDRTFAPRTSGGKPQHFCRPACRRALDAAGRRWIAAALADGRLSIDALRSGSPGTRALPVAAISVAPSEQAADTAAAPSDERLFELFGQILAELSVEELSALPEPVWALINYIAGPEAETDTGGV